MSQTTLHYAPYVPSTATASSVYGGFYAPNVLLGKVQKQWRANSAATTEYLIVDLGSSQVLVNAKLTISAANLFDAQILADTAANPTTSKGVVAFSSDGNGRYKASMVISGTIRYIKIKPNSGAPVDGSTRWAIGPVDLFKSALAVARDPIFGETAVDWMRPQTRTDLDNGISVKDDTGPPYSAITLNFSGGSADDHEAVMRQARAGLCWLDFNIAANRGLQWRVKHIEPKVTRKITAFNRESVQVLLTEQV